jgi:FAD/FMN-containing dehydrogenase
MGLQLPLVVMENVGVGGFLLGGGISYNQAQIGFSCDTIVKYEVVLGNGTIVNANRTANADLWKALKGGGNNFGIVTRFDVEAIAAEKLYYDMRVMSTNY